jgi:hypothetical protein
MSTSIVQLFVHILDPTLESLQFLLHADTRLANALTVTTSVL